MRARIKEKCFYGAEIAVDVESNVDAKKIVEQWRKEHWHDGR